MLLQVTLFGESAGGVSVHALFLSPLSAGLFSAAIAQSGTMLMSKNTYDRKRQERTARALARYTKYMYRPVCQRVHGT